MCAGDVLQYFVVVLCVFCCGVVYTCFAESQPSGHRSVWFGKRTVGTNHDGCATIDIGHESGHELNIRAIMEKNNLFRTHPSPPDFFSLHAPSLGSGWDRYVHTFAEHELFASLFTFLMYRAARSGPSIGNRRFATLLLACVFGRAYVCFFVSLFVWSLHVCLFACLPVCCLRVCLPACLSVCLFVCMSACLPSCLPVGRLSPFDAASMLDQSTAVEQIVHGIRSFQDVPCWLQAIPC